MITYRVAEVAEILKCHRATVLRRIKEGRIKAFRVGGLLRISETELARLAGAGRIGKPVRSRNSALFGVVRHNMPLFKRERKTA